MAPVLLFTASVAAQGFLPDTLESVGLERVVPDRIIFESAEGFANLDNWEPYTGVLGTSTFLIESNKFAVVPGDPDAQLQSYGLVLQPVDGAEPTFGECFYGDDGVPYDGPINSSRQNGNPGRVAGDVRPGATRFITGGEASPQELDAFQNDDRWSRGTFSYIESARFATAQTFEYDPDTGTQTATSRAFDTMYGRLLKGVTVDPHLSRFGGDMRALSDGGFVIVTEDRSGLFIPERSASAVIVDPEGGILEDTFSVAPGSIWTNVAAFQGGFCVRVEGVLHLFGNDGVKRGEADQSAVAVLRPNGASVEFEQDRGDRTRMESHINSRFLFLAGPVTAFDADGAPLSSEKDVWLAAYDAGAGTLVASVNVNELDEDHGGTDDATFHAPVERVEMAVDALNRICVAWEVIPGPDFTTQQTVARVLAFDPDALEFEYLTPTFFPFVNHVRDDSASQVQTFRPNVSMTTKAICIAAKGSINRANDPRAGPDTHPQTNFYTVFSHPAPAEDPTPGVGESSELGPFLRGDCNGDGEYRGAPTDGVFLLSFLFVGGRAPECLAACDFDGNGDVSASPTDALYFFNFNFLGGPPLPLPSDVCEASNRPEDLDTGCERSTCP